jgi:hypothetical protein
MSEARAAQQLHGGGWDSVIDVNHGVEGCALDLLQNQLVIGRFLWRFGVLLATNDQAHKALPALPVAPPDEIAAVGGCAGPSHFFSAYCLRRWLNIP